MTAKGSNAPFCLFTQNNIKILVKIPIYIKEKVKYN